MKRVIVSILLTLIFGGASYAKKAQELPISPNAKEIDIVYVNGAYDDIKSFETVVRGVHDDMVKQFQSDPLMYKKLLDNGNKKIGEKEVIYFWGEQSKENLKALDKALEYTQKVSSVFAQFGRKTLAHLLHDAIWVSKPSNSKILLDNLNKIVKDEHSHGKQVILYGYSAGSLITFDYVSKRLPVFNLKRLESKENYNSVLAPILKKQKINPTCLEALTQSNVTFYTSDDKFVLNPNPTLLADNFKKINQYTEAYCAPSGAIAGVVLFGTPLVTFESDTTKQGSTMNGLSQFLFKYLIENDMFIVSVNYTQDFIGMAMPNKFDVSMLKETPILSDTVPNGGFAYDNSSVKYRVNILGGHSAYWYDGRKFAKSIVETYNEGYNYFYNLPADADKQKTSK